MEHEYVMMMVLIILVIKASHIPTNNPRYLLIILAIATLDTYILQNDVVSYFEE